MQAGLLSGALDAAEAVCRVAAPLAGGYLLEGVSIEGPCGAGMVLCIAGALAFNGAAVRAVKIKRE